jgi:geranylgeranyl diphosphate synthase type II
MGDPRAELLRLREQVEGALLHFLREDVCAMPTALREAAEYSLRAGGKRMRPVVLLSAGGAVGGDGEALLPFACAIEYVHTYSLIHDDLPAMDNDDFRRGRPTCHKAFDEATAILAGDALLTEAFRAMGESAYAETDPRRALEATTMLARAAGAAGMVGGQQMDIAAERGPGSREGVDVDGIHLRKTAALFEAAAGMGALLGGGSEAQVGALARYGRALGLLFQVTDDILDETGSFEEMGKAVAKDRASGKATWPVVHGMAASLARAGALSGEALSTLSPLGSAAEPLREVVRMVAARRS